VPGFEPGCIMDQVIDLYRPRFGAFQHWILKLLAHVKTLTEMRSGTVVVRLGGRAR